MNNFRGSYAQNLLTEEPALVQAWVKALRLGSYNKAKRGELWQQTAPPDKSTIDGVDYYTSFGVLFQLCDPLGWMTVTKPWDLDPNTTWYFYASRQPKNCTDHNWDRLGVTAGRSLEKLILIDLETKTFQEVAWKIEQWLEAPNGP